MINTRHIFTAAGMAALFVGSPALADNRNQGSWQDSGRSSENYAWNGRHDNGRHDNGRHKGNRWDYDNRDDRRDERRAYANGYRDGARQPSYGSVYRSEERRVGKEC